LYQAPNRLTR